AGLRRDDELDLVDQLAQSEKAVERTLAFACPFDDDLARLAGAEHISQQHAAGSLVYFLTAGAAAFDGLLVHGVQIDVQARDPRAQVVEFSCGDRRIGWKSHAQCDSSSGQIFYILASWNSQAN